MLKLKEWIAKVSSSLRLVSTSTSSNLAYHNGKAYFWRQGSIVYFSINGSFTNLPNAGYTTLGTITQGFRPTNPTVFHRQEAGPHNGTNVGLLLKLTNTGEISIYNYTGAVYTGNGYFNGCYACSENLNGVVPASSIPAGVADYVVEQGTSGIWKYRKWYDRTYDAWYDGTINLGAGTAWCGGYYHLSTSDLTPPSFSTGVTSFYGATTGAVLAVYCGASSTYRSYWLNGSSGTLNNVSVHLDMHGTW